VTPQRSTSTTRLLAALELACWWAVGVLLAPLLFPLLLGLLEPPALRIVAPPADIVLQPQAPRGAEVLFGAGGGQEGPPKASELRLLGWMDSGRSGAIVISVRDGPQRTLRRGEPAADGLLFHGIVDDAVVLVRGGQQTRIPLPRSNGLSTPDKGYASGSQK
jgi:hypothetical protein